MKNSTVVISSTIIALALVLGMFLLGSGIAKMRLSDRAVSVKGLSEKIVKADLASWQIPYRATGDVLENVLKEAESSQTKIVAFLTVAGFTTEEIELGQVRVNDKNSDPYNTNTATTNRFVVESRINLRTNNVDAAVKASQKTLELAKTGVVLTADSYSSAPQYEFTKLDELKPAMIAEATKDARKAANQFAQDSGAKVGAIKNAYQGYFSIDPVDSVAGNASLFKKVRVVSTIDFFLEND